eukprot:m.27728 g.27728  ORF g.27728 m.27728 type:complete len:315 (-) comp4449_c0_seq2:20-964(-)
MQVVCDDEAVVDGHHDPVGRVVGQRLGRDNSQIVAPIGVDHAVLALLFVLALVARARGKVQRRGRHTLVVGAEDIPRCEQRAAVGDHKVEHAGLLDAFGLDRVADDLDHAVQVDAQLVRRAAHARVRELVDEQRKAQRRVRRALGDGECEGLIAELSEQAAADHLEATNHAVMHPHVAVVVEGMTAALAHGEANTRGSHVGKHNRRGNALRQAGEVLVVPRRARACEDARLDRPRQLQRRILIAAQSRVPAQPKAVAVEVAALSDALARREALRDDRPIRPRNKVRGQDRRPDVCGQAAHGGEGAQPKSPGAGA